MFVKGKYGIEAEMIYQDEACAVGKTQSFVFKLSENRLCSGFNILSNPVDVYTAFVYLIHKFYSRYMAPSY